jgi:hypothetical protein
VGNWNPLPQHETPNPALSLNPPNLQTKKLRRPTKSPSKGIVDKKTGEKGLIFSVTNIEWKSDTEVHVSGGYCKELLDASGNTYTVKKQKGKWKVTNAQMNWMS